MRMTVKKLIWKLRGLLGQKCKYRNRCELYNENSLTCNFFEYRFKSMFIQKPYCGRYREFEEEG